MFQSRKQVTAVDPPDLTKYKPIILNNLDGKEMRIILAASAILASIVSAQAAAHHKHHHHRFVVRHSADHHRVADRGSIVAHPTGCPRSAFCGCGVSARVFGHSVRSLWLVRNWYQFPRAAAVADPVDRAGGHPEGMAGAEAPCDRRPLEREPLLDHGALDDDDCPRTRE